MKLAHLLTQAARLLCLLAHVLLGAYGHWRGSSFAHLHSLDSNIALLHRNLTQFVCVFSQAHLHCQLYLVTNLLVWGYNFEEWPGLYLFLTSPVSTVDTVQGSEKQSLLRLAFSPAASVMPHPHSPH